MRALQRAVFVAISALIAVIPFVPLTSLLHANDGTKRAAITVFCQSEWTECKGYKTQALCTSSQGEDVNKNNFDCVSTQNNTMCVVGSPVWCVKTYTCKCDNVAQVCVNGALQKETTAGIYATVSCDP